jgi:hypothetical protein
VPFSEPLVHHGTLHPFDELCDYIKLRKWERTRIGVDFDAHYFTARAHKHLYTGLPNAKISDNKELIFILNRYLFAGFIEGVAYPNVTIFFIV